MKETEYAYAVAYTRTLENKMLSKKDLEALLNAPSLADGLRYLSDRGYGASASARELNAETMLKGELAYAWKEIRTACPQGAPVNILVYQNDFHNIKAVLKAVFSGVDYQPLMLEPYTVLPEAIYRAVSDGKPESLPDIFAGSAARAYSVLARDNDGQLAEIILDTALFRCMQELAHQHKSDFLIDWVDLNIALMNMKTALRGAYGGKSGEFLKASMLKCKRMDIDKLAEAGAQGASAVIELFENKGLKEAALAARESIGSFEGWCDRELIKYLRAPRYKAFGFEPVLGFLIAKQLELKVVRVILYGLRSGVSAKALRERIGSLYE